jgi:hypothetical protein
MGEEKEFPFHLRIPGWCDEASLIINEEPEQHFKGGQIIQLTRSWKNGDKIELNLPMHIEISRWAENSVAVQRGPLIYSLKIEEEWKFVENDDKYGDYWDVFPKSSWNYGLLQSAIDHPESGFAFETNRLDINPWNQQNPPSIIRTKGKIIPEWQIYYANAGPLPHSRPQLYLREKKADDIKLIPYGWSTLRITEFPVVE